MSTSKLILLIPLLSLVSAHHLSSSNQSQQPDDTGFVDFNLVWKDLLKKEGKSERAIADSLPTQYDYKDTSEIKDSKNFSNYFDVSWSFAIASNIESLYRIYRDEKVVLSTQELIDCVYWQDIIKQGYTEVMKLGGLETEINYPYDNVINDRKCAHSDYVVKYTIDGWTRLPVADETKMKIWLVKKGPFTVKINTEAIDNYTGGIVKFSNQECSRRAFHANQVAVVVGYGVDETSKFPYWIVKNSRGENWGEEGYFRMFYGENTCGLATNVVAPLLSGKIDA